MFGRQELGEWLIFSLLLLGSSLEMLSLVLEFLNKLISSHFSPVGVEDAVEVVLETLVILGESLRLNLFWQLPVELDDTFGGPVDLLVFKVDQLLFQSLLQVLVQLEQLHGGELALVALDLLVGEDLGQSLWVS